MLCFIWLHHRPRLSTLVLYWWVPGGLAVHHIKFYYVSVHIASLVSLHATPKMPTWAHLAIMGCSPYPVYNLLWTPPCYRPVVSDLLLTHSLRLWDSHLISFHLPLSGILNTPQFHPAYDNLAAYWWWWDKESKYVYEFLVLDGIKLFCLSTWTLANPSSRDLQIHSNLPSCSLSSKQSIFPNMLDAIYLCGKDPMLKGLVSDLYWEVGGRSG